LWLAKERQKAGIAHLRHDHYLQRVDGLEAAQGFLDEQLKRSWTTELRNQDLRRELYGEDPTDAKEKRRRSAKVGRKLAMLRAHGILEKVCKSHRDRAPPTVANPLPPSLPRPTPPLTN
jgi:hypothetical protein